MSSYLLVCGDWRIINYAPCIGSDRLAQHIYPGELRIPTYLSSRSVLGAKIEDPNGPAQNLVPAAMFLALLLLFLSSPSCAGFGGSGSQVDSARMNLASSFVNGFVNAAFGQDKLLTDDGNKWLYKNKDHGIILFLPYICVVLVPLVLPGSPVT